MPGRQLSYWIGQALQDARVSAGIPERTVGAILNMSDRKIQRIEGAEGEEGQSYNGIDRVVAAYAYILGIEDPRELWIDALERWYKEGGIPDFTAELPGAAFLRPIREASQRLLQARGEPEERLRAVQRKRRGAR